MEINKFSELADLKDMIKEDFENFDVTAHRFPIRFIFLNSHEELKEVTDLMINENNLIELTSFLSKDDGWLTPNDIIKNIEKISDNSIVVPLSEFIRFLDDQKFESVLSALAEIENPSIRIYIPLVGLWDRFEDLFYDRFYRQDDWAPIWKLNSENKSIKIYQLAFDFNKNIKTNDLILISNTKEWFELWKKDDDFEEIISLVKPILINFHNSVPDQTFSQDVIKTPREYLSKIYGIDIDIPYDESYKSFWDNLLIYVSNENKKNLSFNEIIADNFNISDVSKIGVDECIDIYLSNITNQYNQWLIKNFVILSKKFINSYLAHCFKAMEKLGNNNLARKIYLEIFKWEYCEKFLDERRLLLEKLNKYDLSFAENEFEQQFKNIDHLNYKQQFKYLTTTTPIEKNKILEIIHNNGLDNITSDLKEIFPDLYHYLDWNFTLNDDIPHWVFDYFNEYNKSKVLNRKSKQLEGLLDEINHPDKFYDWYFKFSKISKSTDEHNYTIWVDALGTEWLPLLIYSLNYYGKPLNKTVKFKTIKSINLPSATDFNKPEYDYKISRLDEYIHNNHYNYPKSLLDEMEVIKEISRQIVKIDSPKITIVSDHGFSFLCTKDFGGFKKYKQFKNAKHEGRYLNWGDKEDVVDEDYMSMKTESVNHENEKYVVTLKHISLYNTPSHEVHGGATPEEVLVPYIILENDDNSMIEYEVSSSVTEINVSRQSKLPITISPEPPTMPLVIFNNEVLPISKEDNQFIIQFNSEMSKGKQKIIIKIGDEEVEELEITINKGGMSEESYDDLF